MLLFSQLAAVGEGGTLQAGVDSGVTTSGAAGILVVVGPTAGTSSETRVSLQAGPRAQVDALERVINVSIKTEVGELVVKVMG